MHSVGKKPLGQVLLRVNLFDPFINKLYQTYQFIALIQPMLDFNLDYLSKQRRQDQKLKALKGYHNSNVEYAVQLINVVNRRSQQYLLGISFMRISVWKRPKVERLLLIENIIKRRYQSSLLSINRYSILSQKSMQIKPENKINYPLSILNRVYNQNRLSKLQIGWQRMVKCKRYMNFLEVRLGELEQLCQNYQKRQFMKDLFIVFRRALDKQSAYTDHLLSFEKIFQIIRVKNLFIGLSNLNIKTEMKRIADLQKEKTVKRDESVKVSTKRNELVNDMKRKTNNMKGQVNEETMRNNKKRTDGSRQNGTKLMKKNQELRGIQMALNQTLSEVQTMEKELTRKENFIKNRPKVSIPFQYLREKYTEFNEGQKNDISKGEVENKIGKSQLTQFLNSSNYVTSQNVKLKYMISLYEQFETSKKTDAYTNLDNENSCLKGLVSSLIRMQYFEPKREKMLKNVDEINSNIEDLKLQMSQLRVQSLQGRKK